MDRSVLEGDPHAVLEGMIIAAYAIGAREGYIYVRAEYPLAVKRLRKAIARREARGLLGEDILGTGFAFDVADPRGRRRLRLRRGDGADRLDRGRARHAAAAPAVPRQSRACGASPPASTTSRRSPTSPWIIGNGARGVRASLGTGTSKGTKVFALTGKVRHSGLVEVPMGITLRELIYDIGGGMPGRQAAFKAVQTGGPSGGCIPAEHARHAGRLRAP